jgi:hypothetical protein
LGENVKREIMKGGKFGTKKEGIEKRVHEM